jgi:predicted nucleotidyltransferase
MFEDPLTKEKLENILCSLRLGLEGLLGEQLEAVYLYGSHARGDAHTDSDIDVLVVLKRKIFSNKGEIDFFFCYRSSMREHRLHQVVNRNAPLNLRQGSL